MDRHACGACPAQQQPGGPAGTESLRQRNCILCACKVQTLVRTTWKLSEPAQHMAALDMLWSVLQGQATCFMYVSDQTRALRPLGSSNVDRGWLGIA